MGAPAHSAKRPRAVSTGVRDLLAPVELLHRGKVRDVYADGDDLVLVASDRVSVYDVVLPTPIPDKGALLTQLSLDVGAEIEDQQATEHGESVGAPVEGTEGRTAQAACDRPVGGDPPHRAERVRGESGGAQIFGERAAEVGSGFGQHGSIQPFRSTERVRAARARVAQRVGP